MESKLVLPERPTLQDFQHYVEVMVEERGFDKETISEIFMLFLEECGELAKAARKTQDIKSDASSQQFELSHELADVFIYLLYLCNRFGVDLEQAFRAKEAINQQRHWN